MSIPPSPGGQSQQDGSRNSVLEPLAAALQSSMHEAGLEHSKSTSTHAAASAHEDEPADANGFRSTKEASPPSDPSPHRLRSLLPPVNFGAVQAGSVYRSSYPQPENYEFLASLKLKTILTLVPEPCPSEYVTFMQQNGIRHFQVHIPANKGTISIPQCQMTEALGVVLDKTNHPILIHCNKGKHRTGCVVGCLRKCQEESFENIFSEYHTYADPKARILDECFIEQFDERTVLWMARAHNWLPLHPLTPEIVGSITSPRLSLLRLNRTQA